MACGPCKQARRDLVIAAGAIVRGDTKQAAEKLSVIASVVAGKIRWTATKRRRE